MMENMVSMSPSASGSCSISLTADQIIFHTVEDYYTSYIIKMQNTTNMSCPIMSLVWWWQRAVDINWCVLQQWIRRILPDTWQQETLRRKEDVWVERRWAFPHSCFCLCWCFHTIPELSIVYHNTLCSAPWWGQHPSMNGTHGAGAELLIFKIFQCQFISECWLVITNGGSKMSFTQKCILISCHWTVRSCKYRGGSPNMGALMLLDSRLRFTKRLQDI